MLCLNFNFNAYYFFGPNFIPNMHYFSYYFCNILIFYMVKFFTSFESLNIRNYPMCNKRIKINFA